MVVKKIVEILEKPTPEEKTGFIRGLYKVLLKSSSDEEFTAYLTPEGYDLLVLRIALLEKGISDEEISAFEDAVVANHDESNFREM